MLDVIIYELAPDESPRDIQGELLLVLLHRDCSYCPEAERRLRRMIRGAKREFLMAFLWGNSHEDIYDEFCPAEYPVLIRYRHGQQKDHAEGMDAVEELLEEFLGVSGR